jgi:uncharacterized protein YndB with AHSA1/START domain
MVGVDEGTPAVERQVDATPAAVWAVLSDGWLYPSWVVGTSRMRQVDEGWPAVGTRLHHSVGNWPLLLDDKTEVLEVVPGRRLRLQAHGWPAGAVEVLIELEPLGTGTRVRIREEASTGPATLLRGPALQMAMVPRNRETLRRLGFLAEGRSRR